jgi:peptidoglycan-associated lipoprotein
MRSAFLISLAAVALSMTACRNQPTVPEEGAATDTGPALDIATTDSSADRGDIGVSRLSPEDQVLVRQLVVYFDYDEAEILPEFNALLAAHGRNLSQNPNMQVRLEGHADERGSREYNIGLGERRAQAVRRVLMLQGAGGQQLTTVSYGEERPAASGSEDESWRLNRRVELVYR